MDAQGRARVIIELDLDAEPVAGVVRRRHGGHAEPFAGWVELIREVELTLAAARRETHEELEL